MIYHHVDKTKCGKMKREQKKEKKWEKEIFHLLIRVKWQPKTNRIYRWANES